MEEINVKTGMGNPVALDDENTAGAVQKIEAVRQRIAATIVGQDEVVDLTLTALLCEGHVLLEGVPGLGKTMLVRTLAQALDLNFSRVQFTPDLMPADVIGTSMVMRNDRDDLCLQFESGPVFGNLVLADEINRASPKTQAALLEAMQERSVTVRGEKHMLPRPFQVLATQNPLEMEGTYPLPEAQIDRFFFKVLVTHPSEAELVTIIERTVGTVPVDEPPVMDKDTLYLLQQAVREVVVPSQVNLFAARLVLMTQPERESSLPDIRRFVRYGAGPRAAQTLVLAGKARALLRGRYHVALEDVKGLVFPAMRHRIGLNFEGQSEGIRVEDLLITAIQEVEKGMAQPV